MENTCVIKIGKEVPGRSVEVDVQLNGVPHIEVIETLQAIQKLLAQEMVAEAKKHVGNDDKAIEKWLDAQRQQAKHN